MTSPQNLSPAPFALTGGPIGVVLLHGFTGAPPEMRLVGEYLHAKGMTVVAPLLPGHGTSPEDMNRSRWTDWRRTVDETVGDLRLHCQHLFVAGLSMGALLALDIASRADGLSGVIAYSPATWTANWRLYLTPLAKYLVPVFAKSGKTDLRDPVAVRQIWCYDVEPLYAAHELLKLARHVRRTLHQVTCPTLVIHSTGDSAIHAQSALRTLTRVGSRDRQMLSLNGSGHCITVDAEWRAVAGRTLEFIRSQTGGLTSL